MGRLTSIPSAVVTDDSALGGAVIDKSLRCNDNDSAYLSRTFGSAGNRRTFTFSFWCKLSESGTHSPFFSNGIGSDFFKFQIRSDGRMEANTAEGGSDSSQVITTRRFWDPSAWYHIVIAYDTTQGTSSNRVKIYINGIHETALDTNTVPSQNHETAVNLAGQHQVGGRTSSSQYFDGYMAEVHFIDGFQLTPSSFGYTEFQTGIWKPKAYVGSYGTNGFRLDFSDNSATTAVTLGKDRSGQGNDFTPNNFSVSAGTGNDSLIDSPTNTFCILNHLTKDSNTTLSDGNLQATGSAGNAFNTNTQGTFAERTGKWYYEVEFTSGSGLSAVGWCRTTLRSTDNPTTGGGIVYRPANGDYLDLAGNNPTSPPVTSAGNIVQVAIDFDAGKIWFGSGGTYFNSGNPSTGASAAMTFTGGAELLAPAVRTLGCTFKFNFGQRAFSYTVPTGFKSLCSNNIPINTPSIIRPRKHFDIITYSGNGSSPRAIGGLEFRPAFVWLKNRNGGNWHRVQNSVAGPNNTMYSNSANDEAPNESNGHVDSFTDDGFIVDDASGGAVNGGSNTFVAWCWKGGGDSNTFSIDGAGYASAAAAGLDGGSINPTGASIDTEGGFSVTTYSGNGSAGATIAHGLGKKPAFIIIKCRNADDNWMVYHQNMHTSSPEDYHMELNATGARQDSNKMLNDTAPTSTLVTIGSDNSVNGSGRTYIMHSWAEIPGYSKFGKYKGNGNIDGPYVELGFRPAFIMMKEITDASTNWVTYDYKRNTYNPVNLNIYPNLNSAEGDASLDYDFLSDGFKVQTTNGGINGDGNEYIYIAFAEQIGNTPFDIETNAK